MEESSKPPLDFKKGKKQMGKNNSNSSASNTVLSLVLDVISAAVYFYVVLPAINPRSMGFWTFILMVVVNFVLIRWILTGLLAHSRKGIRIWSAIGIAAVDTVIFMMCGAGGNSGFFSALVVVIFLVVILIVMTGTPVTRTENNPDIMFIPRAASNPFADFWNSCKIGVIIVAIMAVIILVGQIVSSQIFNATKYYNLLDVPTGDFTDEVAEISYDKIPMLDSDSSIQLGSRALGNISATNVDWVSQFEVSSDYSQINYQNEPVRVSSLKYGGIIKWLNNFRNGLPGYVVVNMVTQEARLVQLDEGMKYTPYDHFGRNIYRYLRFHYPTMMFGDVNFEIDEDGTPWWVCSRSIRTIGLFGGTDTKGAVLVNAITGESQYYEEVPTWVDRVYSADLLVQQYNYHGTLINGWINSWLGKKGVTKTSDGYNYIAMNDDIYMYTGITSVGYDDSNVGFILVNQRTKDARYYAVTGATERSAMSSAEGAVQHLSYSATFPLLLNIADQPTYFMSLKDSANLVKMYAMVNVTDYQITATGSSVRECQYNYEELLVENGVIEEMISSDMEEEEEETEAEEETPAEVEEVPVTHETTSVTGTITEIRTVIVNGNTIFYLYLDDGAYYTLSAADYQDAVILNVGDTITLSCYVDENGRNVGTAVTQIRQAELPSAAEEEEPGEAAEETEDEEEAEEVAGEEAEEESEEESEEETAAPEGPTA